MDNKNTVAVLVGKIDCATLGSYFQATCYNGNAISCLVDYSDGNFIMDDWHDTLGNVYEMKQRKTLKDYENVNLQDDIKNGKTGVTAYESKVNGIGSYMYYTPVGINNWELLIVVQEDVAFSSMRELENNILMYIVIECILLLAFFFWNLFSARQIAKSEIIKIESHAKNDFYSQMSHDMRTPMNGILGLTELAAQENDVDKLHEDIEKIHQSGNYMLGLINDTLDLQRLDTGIGMSEDFIQNSLYKPFSQEDNKMTDKYGGSGLGLSIVKKLIDLMGGSIEVSSELGEGTTFNILLDVEVVSDEEVKELMLKKEKTEKENLKLIIGKRMLLCEDHHLNAEIVKRLLAKIDVEVDWAKDGVEGVETLSLRIDRHVENTKKVVEYLTNHPKVEHVNHPSLSNHPNHDLYERYFPNGGASIFTFDIKGGKEEAYKFIDGLKIFSLLANVADVKSLVIHPATTTHSQLTQEELNNQGIHQNTIRLSIGTEHIDDIIADLENGFNSIK